MLNEQTKIKLTNVCQEILKIRSYSGEEGELVAKLKEIFEQLNFDEIVIDVYGNIIAKIKGAQPGKKILFDAHIDTVVVPESNKWKYDPFGGHINDGKIYGRGASDMKGSLCSMMIAVSQFANDCSKNFSGEIYVAGVVQEECFEGVAARKISENFKPDYVVIGEASELNLKRGQRGRAEIIVETFGKPAHSANPEKGINAVYQMCKLVDQIQKIKSSQDDFLGKAILELTDIKSSPYPGASVVPDYCRATFDRRLLLGETKESVLKPIEECILKLQKTLPECNATVSYAKGNEMCYTGNVIEGERFFPAWLLNEDDDFVQIAYNGLRSVGLNPSIANYSFCTNGSHYAGEAGIKTIGFGPSKENLAHTIDEYIEIEQLELAFKGYYGILRSLFGQS